MPLYHSSFMENLSVILTFAAASLFGIIMAFSLIRAVTRQRQKTALLHRTTQRIHEALRRNCRMFARNLNRKNDSMDEVEIRPEGLRGTWLRFSAPRDAFDSGEIGREMSLFLFYRQETGYRYFTLTGQLAQVEQPERGERDDGEQRGTFILYPTVQDEQRRHFMRVNPPTFMCTINTMHYAPAGACNTNALKVIDPAVVSIGDISSGGIRLHVSSDFEGYNQLAKDDVVLLSVTFTNRDATLTTMDIAGTCLNVLNLSESGTPSKGKALCIMFQRKCLHDHRNTRHVWTPVDPATGIPELYSWVMQVQTVCRGAA